MVQNPPGKTAGGSGAGVRPLARRAWQSPTLSTWLNLAIQSANLVLVLPLVLVRLPEPEVTAYYLFLTIAGLNFIFQFGFQPTFARMFGYAMAGLEIRDMREVDGDREPSPANAGPNAASLARIGAAMGRINRRLAVWALLALGAGGTLAMLQPVAALADPWSAWAAWAVLVGCIGARIACAGYETFLTGAGHVALTQRWQAAFSAATIILTLVLLMVRPSLTGIVLVQQAGVIAAILWNRRLARMVSRGGFEAWARAPADRECMGVAWASAWRSGTGLAASRLAQQLLGVVFAQYGSGPAVASYLLGMRLVTAVEAFAMAPFYSRIPQLNRLRAAGDQSLLETIAFRGIRLSHWVYVGVFSGMAMAGPAALAAIGSSVPFPDRLLWYLLGAAFFLQRYGGMHVQLHSTGNRIIWHRANGLQGIATLAAALLLAPRHGACGFAAALVIGNLPYAAFAAVHSLRELRGGRLRFDTLSAGLPALALLVLAIAEWRWQISLRILTTALDILGKTQ